MVSVLRQRKITFAAAGVSHSIFVDSKGIAYTCGKGRGLLGHGDHRIRTVPTKVESLEVNVCHSIAKVTCTLTVYSNFVEGTLAVRVFGIKTLRCLE